MHNDIERARDALNAIPPDLPRDEWVRAGMAAQAAGLDFDAFDAWSAQAGNYRTSDCRDTWRSFKPGKGVGAGTLFKMARDHGWTDGTPRHNDADLSGFLHKAAKAPRKPQEPPRKPAPGMSPIEVWSRSEPATNAHSYVEKKSAIEVPLDTLRVLPAGDPLRIGGALMAGALVVPAYAPDGTLQSLQLIPPEGKKMNLPGAPMSGASFTVGTISPGRPTYIVEGIGQAWAIWQATGHAAVVCFGAGNMRRIAEGLRQGDATAQLVLVPDAGKESEADKLAADIGAAVAHMPEGESDNFDANDLAQRDGLDALVLLLESAAEPARPEPPAALVQSYDQFIGARKPVVWAVQNMLQRGYIYSLTARWGHGKTAVTLPLGMHVAHGLPWAGFKVEQTRVLFLAGENPDDVRLRALQAAEVFGMDPGVLAENMFFTTRALNLTAVEQAAVLVDQVAALGIGLCFVDTGVAHSAMEEENSNAEMHELAVALRRLSEGLAGAAIVCLMHPPKASSRDTLTTRGGGAFAGEIDGELLLWQDDATKQVELFHGTKLRGPGFKPVFFELQRHTLDMADNFGDSVQTVVAVPVEEGTAPQVARSMTPTQRAAMQSLMRASAEFGELNGDGGLRGVHVNQWRGVFYTASTADSPHAKKVAFQRARSSLCDAGLATTQDDYYKPTDPASGLVCVLAARARETAQNGTVPAHVPGRTGTARHTSLGVCAGVPSDGHEKPNEEQAHNSTTEAHQPNERNSP